MSLSKEQKKDLNQLGEYFRQLELIAVENKIDLDVFMSEYKADGFSVYATEKVSITGEAEKRKAVFQKAGTIQKDKATRSAAKNS
jgi:hypothetical protein